MRQNRFTHHAITLLGFIEYLGLAVITVATIIAGVHEVGIMIDAGTVNLGDLLLMFLYLEILAMVGLVLPVRPLAGAFPDLYRHRRAVTLSGAGHEEPRRIPHPRRHRCDSDADAGGAGHTLWTYPVLLRRTRITLYQPRKTPCLSGRFFRLRNCADIFYVILVPYLDMYMTDWFNLILALPSENATARTRIWRALRALGAASLRDGVWLLPQRAELEPLLAAQVREADASGGQAWLLRVAGSAEHEGLSSFRCSTAVPITPASMRNSQNSPARPMTPCCGGACVRCANIWMG
jgi:hypothetical protein